MSTLYINSAYILQLYESSWSKWEKDIFNIK